MLTASGYEGWDVLPCWLDLDEMAFEAWERMTYGGFGGKGDWYQRLWIQLHLILGRDPPGEWEAVDW